MGSWYDDEILVPSWDDETAFLETSDYSEKTTANSKNADIYTASVTGTYGLTASHDEPWTILYDMWLILASILPVIFFIAIARVTAQKTMYMIDSDSFPRFLLEFVIIIPPTVLFVIVLHEYIYAINIVFLISMVYALYKIYKTKAQKRWYISGGRRPFILTLVRATIYLIASICLLAEEFKMFPIYFEMKYGFSVGLKDTIVGFYVFSMATVERNKQKWYGCKRTVTPLIFLALVRFIRVKYFNYIQPEIEYGEHWNVYVTLAVIKCAGSLYCYYNTTRLSQLFCGSALLCLHEFFLRFSLNDIIMDPQFPRNKFVTANREGISGLPGFLGLYLISVYIGRCLRIQSVILNYEDVVYKIKMIGISCLALWMFLFSCVFVVSVSRVTCNLGYAVWILAMALTIVFFYMVVFHLIINTLWFVENYNTYNEIYHYTVRNGRDIPTYKDILPVLVEAINKNGFFLFVFITIAARINMVFDPLGLDNMYAFILICNAMLFSTGIISLMHHRKLRFTYKYIFYILLIICFLMFCMRFF